MGIISVKFSPVLEETGKQLNCWIHNRIVFSYPHSNSLSFKRRAKVILSADDVCWVSWPRKDSSIYCLLWDHFGSGGWRDPVGQKLLRRQMKSLLQHWVTHSSLGTQSNQKAPKAEADQNSSLGVLYNSASFQSGSARIAQNLTVTLKFHIAQKLDLAWEFSPVQELATNQRARLQWEPSLVWMTEFRKLILEFYMSN